MSFRISDHQPCGASRCRSIRNLEIRNQPAEQQSSSPAGRCERKTPWVRNALAQPMRRCAARWAFPRLGLSGRFAGAPRPPEGGSSTPWGNAYRRERIITVRTPGVKLEVRVTRRVLSGRAAASTARWAVLPTAQNSWIRRGLRCLPIRNPKSAWLQAPGNAGGMAPPQTCPHAVRGACEPCPEISKSEIYFRASCNATIWSATARRIVSRRGMPAAFSGLSASKPSAGNRAPPSV